MTSFKESEEMSGRTELCDTLPRGHSENGQACGEVERNAGQYDYILTSFVKQESKSNSSYGCSGGRGGVGLQGEMANIFTLTSNRK